MRWALTNDLNIKDEDKLIALPAANAQGNSSPTPVSDAAKLSELGFINAEISNFNGDYRAALNSVNRFVANLKADKNVATVEVLQAPVNVSSYVGLQGSTSDELSTQKQPALFKIKILLKPTDLIEGVALGKQAPLNQKAGSKSVGNQAQ